MSLIYYKAHLVTLTNRSCSIFSQSRKISKTKKKNNRKQSYYGCIDKKMPNKRKGSSKSFDQKEQSRYEKYSIEEQEDKDLTFEAIRCVSRHDDPESKKILKDYLHSYQAN